MNCRKSCKQLVLLACAILVFNCSVPLFSQEYDQEYQEENELTIYRGTEICLLVGMTKLNAPYNFSVDLGLDYIVTGAIDPFYVGVGLKGFLGIPEEDFPYKYSSGNITLINPFLAGAVLSIPLGVVLSPFNNSFAFVIGVRPGLSMQRLFSFTSDAASKFKFGFYGELSVGIILFGLELSVHVVYDTVGKFEQGFIVSYRVPLKFKGKEY